MTTKQLLVTNRKAVREVFEKSDQDVERDIEIIRKWIESQPHLPEISSDNMIEMFLTMNKYSIEVTKKKLDMYYTIRSYIPEIYENSHPLHPRMQDLANKNGIFVPLPKPTEDNYRVFVAKATENLHDFDLYTLFSHVANTYEMKVQHDITVGDIYLMDPANLKMGHLTKITPIHLFKMTTILEKVFSNRVKGMHVVNHPPFINILMAMAKQVLKPKLFSRIYLHNSIEEVYEYVPRKILPKDYGGDEVSLHELTDNWNEYLARHSERFDKLVDMKVKEELRPIPLKNDEILGYYGNFKKLDVD